MISIPVTLALLLAALTAQAQAPLPRVRPHPRLQIDAAQIRQIRALRDANDPLWTRFHNYIKAMPTTRAFPASVVHSYLLAYIVTEDRKYSEGAWRILKEGIYENGSDRSGGLKPLLRHFGDQHAAAFLGSQYIALVAHFYDWCGPLLSAGEKRDVIDWINQACEYTYLNNPDARSRFRNDGAAAVYGLAAAAYGTLGDNPEAPKLHAWFRDWWQQTLKCLDIMGKGGASGEGNTYGISPTAFSLIRTANVVYSASGENLFASHPWFKQRLAYDAFSAYPAPIGGPKSIEKWPAVSIVEVAPVGGDGRHGSSLESRDLRLRQNGLLLSRHFAGTPEAAMWNWVYRQTEVDHAVNEVESYSDLLYYSPRPRLVKPSRLSFFDPSMGFVYIRSDWDSPDATWISFWAGPHLDTHQHLDQGGFTIFKRRDLAPKTGHYDDIRGPHQLSWYVRTVSSNGLLIGDPHESFQGFIGGMGCDGEGKGPKVGSWDAAGDLCPANDGGQRTMRPFSLAPANADVFEQHREVFDVAKVVHFRDTGEAVTVAADLTNAYNNRRYSTPGNLPKVERVYRRLVYLRRPDVLLVGDTVESTNPEFEKKSLIHALDRIEVNGEGQKISEGELVYGKAAGAKIIVDDADRSDKFQTTFDLRRGYSSLLIKTLFPVDFRYRMIGGREAADTPDTQKYSRLSGRAEMPRYHRHIKDFWVRDYSEGVIPFHRSANWPPEAPIEATVPEYQSIFGPGYGRWRLEVEPAKAHKTEYFLNVLMPSLDRTAALPPVDRIEDARSFGAELRSGGRVYKVIFSKQEIGVPEVIIR